VEGIVARASILLVDGVVGHSSTERSTSTLSVSISSTTAKQESTCYRCTSDTCNYSSSKSSNKAYRDSTASCGINVATSVVGKITTRNSTIVCIWALNIYLLTTRHCITMSHVANIYSCAVN
jgi:hypothetical protein